MNNENQELIQAVTDISDAFYEKYGDFCPHVAVEIHGYAVTLVKLYWVELDLEVLLWISENDDRHFFEKFNEYEKFQPFLCRKINEVIDKISKIKL